MSADHSKPRCFSPAEAQRFYDWFGAWQDTQRFYENRAIADLLAHGAFDASNSVIEFGCGTGRLAEELLRGALPQSARYVGLDVSSTMVSLTLRRLRPWQLRARAYQSDGSAHIPEADGGFDRFVSTYVFDLLAPDFLRQLLAEARRVLAPGGKLCLVSMTSGHSLLSRAVAWGWKGLWRLNPAMVGGCRPVDVCDYMAPDNWTPEHRAVITQWGIASEVVVVRRR